jgi:Putative peptidoglycan binding domain
MFLAGRRGRRLILRVALALVALVLLLPAWALASSGGAGEGSSGRRHVKPRAARGSPFNGRAMWIWVLGSSDGGNLGSIVAQARRYGVATLIIKSGDGSSGWSQFNAPLVSALHASGLHVCAWQYVYGTHPITEAYVGAAAVHDGADCLLIDAESQYEGKYVQAQAYMQRLRSLIGANFPLALAGFPYVDYHRAFPYSVFLGPGGAQYNAPQMYWRDIGTTVDGVFAHTFVFNRPYQRPIFPLGQVYNNPPARQIRRFRQLSRAYGSPGVSWWDWQEAPTGAWGAIAQAVGPLGGFAPDTAYATVGSGALGDLVVWAQEHLVSAGEPVTIDGSFGPQTLAAVEAFQAARGLALTGLIDTPTWQALLRYPPAHVKWVIRKKQLTATAAGADVMVVPKSASARARRYEIPRSFGAGRPPR